MKQLKEEEERWQRDRSIRRSVCDRHRLKRKGGYGSRVARAEWSYSEVAAEHEIKDRDTVAMIHHRINVLISLMTTIDYKDTDSIPNEPLRVCVIGKITSGYCRIRCQKIDRSNTRISKQEDGVIEGSEGWNVNRLSGEKRGSDQGERLLFSPPSPLLGNGKGGGDSGVSSFDIVPYRAAESKKKEHEKRTLGEGPGGGGEKNGVRRDDDPSLLHTVLRTLLGGRLIPCMR